MNAAPATYTPRDKQTRFSKRNKGKRKTKQTYLGFKFKHRQVNDSSQSNQRTDHLNSQLQTIMLKQSIRFLSTRRPLFFFFSMENKIGNALVFPIDVVTI
jgi:hypothetical protein